jgi:NDP-sugar pyrophosphorylase family protein
MDGLFAAAPFAGAPRPLAWLAPGSRVEAGVAIEGPCYIDEGTIVKAGARIGPYAVIGRQCQIEEDATVDASIVWSGSRIGRDATVRDSILGRHCHVGRSAVLDGGVLGDKSAVTDYSKI